MLKWDLIGYLLERLDPCPTLTGLSRLRFDGRLVELIGSMLAPQLPPRVRFGPFELNTTIGPSADTATAPRRGRQQRGTAEKVVE